MSLHEIERKFLLKEMPPAAARERGTAILQGYLAHSEHMEVRIRQQGRDYFLTIKEGHGLKRTEREVAISASQFQTLWPATEGRRVEKIRTAIRHGRYRIEIDRYLGSLEPLVTAEVEFPTLEAGRAFDKPDYFGEELTDQEAYKNLSLAIHGAPHKTAPDFEIGALPYLFRGGRLHVVLVTNSAQSRWIIPKGQPEPTMPRHDVAIMEAMEEAGVIAAFHSGLRGQCKRHNDTTLHVYPLRVSSVLKKWPEMAWRRREVVLVPKAMKMIDDRELSECVGRLAERLTS